MLLSTGELARIEAMIEEGRVYDEPGTLSCTDAALRQRGSAAPEATLTGEPTRSTKSPVPRRALRPGAGQAHEIDWLDLPDLGRVIALRRQLLLDDHGPR